MLIKVCGLTSKEQIDRAIDLGYTAIGTVLHGPSPRYCSNAVAKDLALHAGGRIKKVAVGVTYDEVRDVYDYFDYVQIYEYRKIEKLIYAGKSMIENGRFDMFLYDVSRGSGEFTPLPDWVHDIKDRLIISGGLNPDNVKKIITEYRPFGVDVSSGVEKSRGVKDVTLMKKFIDEVKDATR